MQIIFLVRLRTSSSSPKSLGAKGCVAILDHGFVDLSGSVLLSGLEKNQNAKPVYFIQDHNIWDIFPALYLEEHFFLYKAPRICLKATTITQHCNALPSFC